jgi:AsmA-like C-terminal region
MRHAKRWIWISTGIAAGFVILAVLFVAAVPLSSDSLRHRIVKTLSVRLNSDVELGDLHLRVFPRLRAEGASLTIRKRGRADVPPLITVQNFHVEADLIGLLRKRVEHVKLEGLTVQIPPGDKEPDDKDTDDHERDAGSVHATATTGGDTEKPHEKSSRRARPGSEQAFEERFAVVAIDRLDAPGARLMILPRDKNKTPKTWAIHTLRMRNVGAGRAMPFDAKLTNAVPPGEIATTGTFGPWITDAEGKTPLEGTFTFNKADLSVFKGISGILSSKGTYGGSLSWIDVHGETETPDFTITVGGHPFALHTKYHSIVDGTNGDTLLERIDASFLKSSLVARGAVLDEPGHVKGRIVNLDIDMEQARIEDVMTMAVKSTPPPMTGALKLVTKFLLPPGETDVVDRLRLDGRFTMAGARFTNQAVQTKIVELSRRGRGQAADAAKQNVASNFAGRFKLADGTLSLPELKFEVPGAEVQLAGAYGLKAETINFKGQLLLDAKISETTTGFKSTVLKAIDPLFKREGGGSAIPIKIEGTRGEPKFGLDMGRVFKKGDSKS